MSRHVSLRRDLKSQRWDAPVLVPVLACLACLGRAQRLPVLLGQDSAVGNLDVLDRLVRHRLERLDLPDERLVRDDLTKDNVLQGEKIGVNRSAGKPAIRKCAPCRRDGSAPRS